MHVCRSAIINIISQACYEASKDLLRDFGELSFLRANKNVNEFVEKSAQRSFNIIKRILEVNNVGHGFITGNQIIKQSETNIYWVIEAIDNKQNFLHRLPLFGTSIALIDLHGAHVIDFKKVDILNAVYYDPNRDETFWAEKNKGAFLNSRKLLVNQPFLTQLIAGENELCNRYFGSSALHFAYVAASRIDAACEKIDAQANIAVGTLLIQEARGWIKHFSDCVIGGNSAAQRIVEKKFG